MEQVKAMGIKQVLAAPRLPWKRAYIERVIGTIRRECLDHMIVFNEGSLRFHVQNSHTSGPAKGHARDGLCPTTGNWPNHLHSRSWGLHHRYERSVA
jgi:transposase InsO family protein